MTLEEKLRTGEITLDEALYPGQQLSDFEPEDLVIQCIPSGFPTFDKSLVLKHNRGELVLIGARPSHGKSALLFQLATNVASIGKVHVFSLEMDKASVVTRQVAGIVNRPIDAIQMGLHTKDVLRAREQMKNLNFVIDDRAGLTIDEIIYEARQEHSKSRTLAIFIDYIQIIKSESGYSRANEVAEVSSKLKALAKELRVPVIVASQLNRNNELRENKKPMLSDLKESGSLEQDADVVILIQRNLELPKEATVIIAKNRNGPTSELLMDYAAAQTKFIDKGESDI